MERKQVEERFVCGKVLHEFSDNKILITTIRAIYTLLGIWILHNVWHSDDSIAKVIGYIALSFALWRIYSQGESLIFLCEGSIVVKRRPQDLEERVKTLFNDSALYIQIEYDKVVGFNQEWNLLFLGEVRVGGVYAIPVGLQYLNLKDKEFIIDFINKHKDYEQKSEPEKKNIL